MCSILDALIELVWHQVLAGVMLSFGGLLSEIVGGGSPGLTESNPGLVKALSGFVFPVGLVMYVYPRPNWNAHRLIFVDDRIVLQGHELVTSNMMVSQQTLFPCLRTTLSAARASGVPHGYFEACRTVVGAAFELDYRYEVQLLAS